MTSENPRQDISILKTIAVMDRAFAAIWKQVRADDPSATMPTIAS